MTYTLFTGCSYTEGSGFEANKQEPRLWVNQLYHKHFAHTTLLNLGTWGRSNQGIFQDTVKSLVSMPVRYAIVQWTSAPRYEIQLGFELYNTRVVFTPNSPLPPVAVHNTKYNSKYLNEIRNRFTSLAHSCWDIIEVVNYTNIILNLAKFTNTQVFFVNGICPWDKDFFVRRFDVLPNEYTPYTKQILEVETRDDSNTFALYNKLHNQFDADGGIDPHNWLNLYQSMRNNRIDVNADKVHPGLESNDCYTEMFSKSLQEQLQDL